MKRLFQRAIGRPGWGLRLAAMALAIVPAGCSPEGTGTIKIEDPAATRAKFEGGNPAGTKPATAKQAKALELEEEAAKKKPKLR